MNRPHEGKGIYAEIVIRIDYAMQSKTRDVPVWEPSISSDSSKPDLIRATMYNAPAVQMIEDYISDIAGRTKAAAIKEASALGLDSVTKMLEDPKRPCSVVIRLGEVSHAGSADIDNATKMILDGLQPAVMDSDSQVQTLRVDAPPSRELARNRRMPTYVSVITAPNLALLEMAPQMFGGAFVFPRDLYEFSFTKRYREGLFPNVRILNSGS